VRLFDGTVSAQGHIHDYLSAALHFSDGTRQALDFLVTHLDPCVQIVLGLSWLQKYNPPIDWVNMVLTLQKPMQMVSVNQAETMPQWNSGSLDPADTELDTLQELAPWDVPYPLVRDFGYFPDAGKATAKETLTPQKEVPCDSTPVTSTMENSPAFSKMEECIPVLPRMGEHIPVLSKLDEHFPALPVTGGRDSAPPLSMSMGNKNTPEGTMGKPNSLFSADIPEPKADFSPLPPTSKRSCRHTPLMPTSTPSLWKDAKPRKNKSWTLPASDSSIPVSPPSVESIPELVPLLHQVPCKSKDLEMRLINAAAFSTLLRSDRVEFFCSVNIRPNARAGSASMEPSTPPVEDLEELIPEKYKEFSDIFRESDARELPPHCPYDHPIDLEPDARIPHSGIYSMSERELDLFAPPPLLQVPLFFSPRKKMEVSASALTIVV
jgi:hypothetical protein